MPPGPRTLKDIQPPVDLRAWYRRRLQLLARAMAKDALRLVRQHYSAPSVAQPLSTGPSVPPPSFPRSGAGDEDPGLATVGAALDAMPAVELRRALADWGVRWEQKFDRMAADLARVFANRSRLYLDAAFKRRLRDAGFTVRFMPSPGMVTAHQAVVRGNVALIRSIPRQFHRGIEKLVTKATMAGGAQRELSQAVRRRYGVTYRRAALIARDQSAKAKAVLEAARRDELGITTAQWMHSHAGKEPRPEHVRWGRERREFDVTKGLWSEVDQEWQLPGTAINCRCGSRSIIPDSFARASERTAVRRGVSSVRPVAAAPATSP